MNLHKHKPIYEKNVLQLFAQLYPNQQQPHYEFRLSLGSAQDGYLREVSTNTDYPAELVSVTDEEQKKRNIYLVRKRGYGEVHESYGSKKIIETIKKKESKNYSDIQDRILVLDAGEATPIEWIDQWHEAIKYAQGTRFRAIFAICPSTAPRFIVLKN